jgi:hypothetical protein
MFGISQYGTEQNKRSIQPVLQWGIDNNLYFGMNTFFGDGTFTTNGTSSGIYTLPANSSPQTLPTLVMSLADMQNFAQSEVENLPAYWVDIRNRRYDGLSVSFGGKIALTYNYLQANRDRAWVILYDTQDEQLHISEHLAANAVWDPLDERYLVREIIPATTSTPETYALRLIDLTTGYPGIRYSVPQNAGGYTWVRPLPPWLLLWLQLSLPVTATAQAQATATAQAQLTMTALAQPTSTPGVELIATAQGTQDPEAYDRRRKEDCQGDTRNQFWRVSDYIFDSPRMTMLTGIEPAPANGHHLVPHEILVELFRGTNFPGGRSGPVVMMPRDLHSFTTSVFNTFRSEQNRLLGDWRLAPWNLMQRTIDNMITKGQISQDCVDKLKAQLRRYLKPFICEALRAAIQKGLEVDPRILGLARWIGLIAADQTLEAICS